MTTNENGATLEQGAPSKNNLKASAVIIAFQKIQRKAFCAFCRVPAHLPCKCAHFIAIAERQRARRIELRGGR